MATATLELFLRHLRLERDGVKYAALPDGELLAAYAGSGDERAFAELVTRHGPMVLATCRRLLGPSGDAEDAFQAVFTILAAKAKSLHGDRLPGWLHRVAFDSANRVRVIAMRRVARERRVAPAVSQEPQDDLGWEELKLILDEELIALPDEPRELLVRHYLMGYTQDRLSEELGIPRGSVAARLKTACEKLRARLKHRGVTAPLIILTTEMTLAGGKVSAALLVTSVAEALSYATGGEVKPVVAATAHKVLAGMSRQGLKIAVAAASLVATSLTTVTASVITASGTDSSTVSSAENPVASDRTALLTGRLSPAVANAVAPPVTLAGQVTDIDGRPIANADVAAFGYEPVRSGHFGRDERPVAAAKAGPDGQFRFDIPARFPTLVMGAEPHAHLFVTAPGHAAATLPVRMASEVPHLTVRLTRSQSVLGHVGGPDGRPVAGARVVVTRIGQVVRQPTWGLDDSPRAGPWPAGAVTDNDGGFEITGVDPVHGVALEASAPGFAARRVDVPADGGDSKLSIRLGTRRLIEGAVLCGDTGESLAGARVIVVPTGLSNRNDAVDTYGRSDGVGRFAVPSPKSGRPLVCVPASG